MYSKEVIAFSNPDTDRDKLLDAIPLFELEETANMKDDETEGNSERMGRGDANKSGVDVSDHPEKDKKQGDTNKVKFRHSFQLRTKPDGYNSGRQYIIQARSDEERQKIITDLNKLSKIAIDKFLAKSQFRKIQVRACKLTCGTRGRNRIAAAAAWPRPEASAATPRAARSGAVSNQRHGVQPPGKDRADSYCSSGGNPILCCTGKRSMT